METSSFEQPRAAFARAMILSAAFSAAFSAACSAPPSGEPPQPLGEARAPLTSEERLAACADDPRVVTGLVSPEVCAGADIFFRETFEGNGRTCGSCHPAANNTTIDVPFVARLHDTDPANPLFVFERDPALANLETRDLLEAAAILENVDGFEDPTNKFVSRSVNHVLSLSTSLTPDPDDGTESPPVQRTGWGGDGAPDDGSLRAFLTGAIRQHFTKNLARRDGTDFRLPTAQELELTEDFQLSLGRRNELDLERVSITDPQADNGRLAFLDPLRGRCNVCHQNAGANFMDSGKNRNFDQGVRIASGNQDRGLTQGTFNGITFVDGGFGVTQPIDGNGAGENNAFGDATFSPPPLIEAADTGPWFHNNARGIDIEDAVAFYASGFFQTSVSNRELDERFGPLPALGAEDSGNIARFLRVLNAAFNMDIASQRLDAARTLATELADNGSAIQGGLLDLAVEEIDDALTVLSGRDIQPEAQGVLATSKGDIAAARSAASAEERAALITGALVSIASARGQLGSNINFQLGEGNLMF